MSIPINVIFDGVSRQTGGGALVILNHLKQSNRKTYITFILDFKIELNIKSILRKLMYIYLMVTNSKIPWMKKINSDFIPYYTTNKNYVNKEAVNILTGLFQVQRLNYGNCIYFAQHWEFWSHEKNQIIKLWEKYPVITCSYWLKDYALKNNVNSRIEVVQNGVDIDSIESFHNERKFDIVFYYSPIWWKRSDIAIDVVNKVMEKRKNSNIIVISPVKKPTKDLNECKWIISPSRKEVAKILAQSKAVLITSLLEGFCLPAAEGLKSGAIVVSTDCGGISDFIVNNETGFIIKDEHDITINSRLSNKLIHILENMHEYEIIKKNGKLKFSNENFSIVNAGNNFNFAVNNLSKG